VETVIGLPPGLFYGTGIHATIMLFNRSKKDNNILFIDASGDFEQGNPQNTLRKQDITRIVITHKTRKTVDKYSYLASYEEIKEKDYTLNIPRYVDIYEPKPDIDIVQTQKEIDQLEIQLGNIQKKMSKNLGELGYGS
jgi:type I restriction enzyme M protein